MLKKERKKEKAPTLWIHQSDTGTKSKSSQWPKLEQSEHQNKEVLPSTPEYKINIQKRKKRKIKIKKYP